VSSAKTQPHSRLDDRATWLISRAYARSTRLLSDGFDREGDGLRGRHYRLLLALDEDQPASQAELGQRTGIDRADVSTALRELETRELVVRDPAPGNRSQNVVRLTGSGRTCLDRLDTVVDDIQERLLAPLSEPGRRQLIRLLRAVVEAVDD
jgi:DNA-binding MarR family transcriptional regulator